MGNSDSIFKNLRNSRMNLGDVYFWTDTIKDWKHLLKRDEYKNMITDCLKWLVDRDKIKV
jgi:putative transposase